MIWAAALALTIGQAGVAPDVFVLPGHRVHVIASEDLDPDALRALARENVVLWLRTRSNALRESTVENVARFPEAYVELRPPLLDAQLQALRRASRAGAWIRGEMAGEKSFFRLGHRPVAVSLTGALEREKLAGLARLRVTRVDWSPGATPDLLSWGHAQQLSGRRLVRLAPVEGARCGKGTAFFVDARQEVAPEPSDCAVVVRVSPTIGDAQLQRLYRAYRSVELEVEVGDDELLARKARALLERLEAAGPSPGSRP